MIILAAVPVLIGLAVFLGVDRLARRLRPRHAVPLLTGLALSVALCTGLALSAAALLVCVQWGPIPRLGQWSAAAVSADRDFPSTLGVLALVVVAVALVAALCRAARSLHDLLSAARACARLQPIAGDLVLIDDAVPTAYSVAGRPGRVVVSRSMLANLSADERRVLLAHEAAHLRHRHHLYVHLARLAAAANPLLRPVVATVRQGIERWADEDAAVAVGSRTLAAQALARAALARSGHPVAPGGLAAADHGVVDRVQALLAPAPAYGHRPVAVISAAVALSWAAATALTLWANDVIQFAESVYPHR